MSSVARSEASGAVRYRPASGMKRNERESSTPRNQESTRAAVVRKIINQVVFYSLLLGVWALLAKLKVWPPYLFPAPWQVAEALWAGLLDHSFLIAIGVTMKRMVIGYSLSVVLGMTLGIGVASNRFLEETVGPLLVSLQSLPSICWVPLAILWFGLTEKAILFVVLMGCILSVTIAMEDGRKQMPKIYTMAGRNLGASGLRLFWHVMLPASLPYIVSGLKQGWAFGWRSLIQAEMIFLTIGLGQQLMMGRDLNESRTISRKCALDSRARFGAPRVVLGRKTGLSDGLRSASADKWSFVENLC